MLRLVREGRAAADELVFWDAELVREGGWLTWRRHEVMTDLAVCLLGRHHADLSGPGEELTLEYRPNVPLADEAAGMEESFRQALAAAAGRERAQGITAAGPHRDDFHLMINGVGHGHFCITGTSADVGVESFAWPRAEVLASVRGDGPIVLLDDALSEIDRPRRHRVLEKASRYQQVLITTTDLEPVADYFGAGAVYYQVNDGGISPL